MKCTLQNEKKKDKPVEWIGKSSVYAPFSSSLTLWNISFEFVNEETYQELKS